MKSTLGDTKLTFREQEAADMLGQLVVLGNLFKVLDVNGLVQLRWSIATVGIFWLLVGCSPDQATAPGKVLNTPTVSASYEFQTQTHDDCYYGFYSTCHANEVTFEDEYYLCPEGCHTYPLYAGLRALVIQAINRIDTSRCPWAKPYLNQLLSTGQIQYYPIPTGTAMGDIHGGSKVWNVDGNPDYRAVIHLDQDFAEYNNVELAKTLVHEGYHGFFSSKGDEADRVGEANAQFCVH